MGVQHGSNENFSTMLAVVPHLAASGSNGPDVGLDALGHVPECENLAWQQQQQQQQLHE
jgi:hypothetical protein